MLHDIIANDTESFESVINDDTEIITTYGPAFIYPAQVL